MCFVMWADRGPTMNKEQITNDLKDAMRFIEKLYNCIDTENSDEEFIENVSFLRYSATEALLRIADELLIDNILTLIDD